MKYLETTPLLSLFFIVLLITISSCSDDDTVDPSAPTVTATSPANNATNVARNNVIEVSFSTSMDPTTINSSTIMVKQGSTIVPGTVTYDGILATFTPSTSLSAETEYTLIISTGAKSMTGKAFASDNVTKFTTGGSTATRAVVNLGSAANYVIVAKTAINNTATSAITGDLGLSPAATSYMTGFALVNATGFATSGQVVGKLYAADMADPTPANLTNTVSSMITAYNDAAGRVLPDFLELGSGDIGGKTLSPGLYKWAGNVTVPTNVIISGDANDVWIFQISGNLSVTSAVTITLAGGAQAKNIFWQVAGQATLGTTSHFEGIILSMTGITMQTGATLNGQVLAQTAVILDSNVIVKK
jgi:hypothetical protein